MCVKIASILRGSLGKKGLKTKEEKAGLHAANNWRLQPCPFSLSNQ
jgi:hypothetical protein